MIVIGRRSDIVILIFSFFSFLVVVMVVVFRCGSIAAVRVPSSADTPRPAPETEADRDERGSHCVQ